MPLQPFLAWNGRRRRQRRRKAMTLHDFQHLCLVGWTASRSFQQGECFAEILWADCGRRDNAERLRIRIRVVIEAMNGAARNAERFPMPDIDCSSFDGPCQGPFDAV